MDASRLPGIVGAVQYPAAEITPAGLNFNGNVPISLEERVITSGIGNKGVAH
jgi:hypothetical protein